MRARGACVHGRESVDRRDGAKKLRMKGERARWCFFICFLDLERSGVCYIAGVPAAGCPRATCLVAVTDEGEVN